MHSPDHPADDEGALLVLADGGEDESVRPGEAEGAGSEATSWRDEPLGRRAQLAAGALVAAQVIAVVVFAAITVARYPMWSPVDEGAHFENVIYVAQHGTFPVLGKTLAGEQELAIAQGVYPAHTTINPRTDGLAGLAYEAFQPPLYYYAAAPVTFLSSNYHTKAVLLRVLGLLLAVASIALFARLSRRVLRRKWLLGLAAGMLVFLMPGLILRMVTISNMNLAEPLAILIVTELWIAWERLSARRLVVCGALLGCGILADLYLVALVMAFVPVAVVILRHRRTGADVAYTALGSALVGLVVLPWVISNEITYHALTANAIAKREQQPIVNPMHLHYTVGQLPGLTVQNMFEPLMPQEWGGSLIGHDFLSYLATVFQILLVPVALVLAVALGRRLFTRGYYILLAPWVGNILVSWYIVVGQQWQVMLARYTLPTLPMLALFEVAAVLALFRKSVVPLVVTVAISTGFLVTLWIHLVPTIHTS